MSLVKCGDEIEYEDLETNQGCDDQGITSAYYMPKKKFDLEAMSAAQATYFDEDRCVFSDFVFKPNADSSIPKFKRLYFDQEDSFYNSNRADENSKFYDHTITNLFNGKSPEQTKALAKIASICGGFVIIVFTENCQVRVFGIEWNARTCRFQCIKKGMKMGRHVDTHGQLGQEGSARDEFDWVGKGRCPAPYMEIDEKDFITQYVEAA